MINRAKNTNNSFRYLKVALISVASLGCQTLIDFNEVSSTDDRNIAVVDKVSFSCTLLENISASSNKCESDDLRTKLENRAKVFDRGTHLVLGILGGCNGNASVFHCPATFDMTDDELKKLCNKNKAEACIDYGTKLSLSGKPQEALAAAKKACDLKDKRGCNQRDAYTQKARMADSLGACRAGIRPQACQEVAAFSYSQHDYKSAVFFSQSGCAQGDAKACEFNRSILNELNYMQAQDNARAAQNAEDTRMLLQNQPTNTYQPLVDLANRWAAPPVQQPQQQQPQQLTNCTTTPVYIFGKLNSYETVCK